MFIFFSEINQELTRALHDRLLQGGKKVHVLGVDLDAELVQRANEKQMLTQRPTDVEFQPLDVVTDPQVGSPFSVVFFKLNFCFCCSLYSSRSR